MSRRDRGISRSRSVSSVSGTFAPTDKDDKPVTNLKVALSPG